MRLLLAPMEGVVDSILRDVLTQVGGLDQCVTEFMRVTTQLQPDHVFYRYCPELLMGSRTRSGTPIFYQLLGGHPEPMAANALRAQQLGALGVDLNFGCPAKTVNRNDGGATLLKTPERIYAIVKAVRQAVPLTTPVTAKIRLGFDDPSQCLENAKAATEGGAHWLTVHARTKTDGYRPPAYWEWLPRIAESIPIPVIANGEVWNVEDYWRCREVSGCQDVMIGRGAISNPMIFQQIRRSWLESSTASTKQKRPSLEWTEVSGLIPGFFAAAEVAKSGHFAQSRTKQWLKSLALAHPQAKELFERLKVITIPQQFKRELESLRA
jgi:tRNA-dihydrouridine synthase C